MRSDPELILADDAGPLARMLGGLIAANMQADPRKGEMAARARGVVSFSVSDTGEEVVMHLGPGAIRIGAGDAVGADLRLVGTADTIMGLTTIPLRFGLPDPLSAAGRGLTGRWIGGGLQVHGLPRHTPLLRTLLGLCTVLS